MVPNILFFTVFVFFFEKSVDFDKIMPYINSNIALTGHLLKLKA